MKTKICIELILILIMSFYSCKQSSEITSQEKNYSLSDVKFIESNIASMISNANPASDSIVGKKVFDNLFNDLDTIVNYSKDSSVIAKAKDLLDKRTEFLSEYIKIINTIIGNGTITSVADGYDVINVNLWSSTGSDRQMTGSLKNGDKVEIWTSTENYYLVYSKEKDVKGYLMKGFIININQ